MPAIDEDDIELDIVCKWSATKRYVLTLTNDDDSAFVLTGYTATMNIIDGSNTIALTVGSGITINAPGGTVTVVIDTSVLPKGAECDYSMHIDSPGGDRLFIMAGTITTTRS